MTVAGVGTAGGGRTLVGMDMLGMQTGEKKKVCVAVYVRALIVSGACGIALIELGPSARALWPLSAGNLG